MLSATLPAIGFEPYYPDEAPYGAGLADDHRMPVDHFTFQPPIDGVRWIWADEARRAYSQQYYAPAVRYYAPGH